MSRSSIVSANSVKVPVARPESNDNRKNDGMHNGWKTSLSTARVKVKDFFSNAGAKAKNMFSGFVAKNSVGFPSEERKASGSTMSLEKSGAGKSLAGAVKEIFPDASADERRKMMSKAIRQGLAEYRQQAKVNRNALLKSEKAALAAANPVEASLSTKLMKFFGMNKKTVPASPAKPVISGVIPGTVKRLDGVGLNLLNSTPNIAPEAPPKPPRLDALEIRRVNDVAAAKLAAEPFVLVETPEEIFGSAADQLFENHEYHQALPYEMEIYSRAASIREGFTEEMGEVRFDAWTRGASDRLAKSKYTSLIKLLDDGEKFNARLRAIGTRIGAKG